MDTFGAVVIALVLLAIPAILVLPPIAAFYVRCAPLRAQAALESAREERAARH